MDDRLLADLHEVRTIMEPAAAALAALRRTDADLAALAAALEHMAEATTTTAAVDADLAFHRRLLAAAHNEFVERMEIIIEPGLAQRDLLVHGAAHDHDPVPVHQSVLDAIRDGDADRAREAVNRLLEQGAADLVRLHPDGDGLGSNRTPEP